MHDKGTLFPKRKDFFDASAGVERFLLVAERYGAATVLWLGAGERFVPSEFQARCVDDELRNAVFYKIIHGVLDKRFLEDRHEGFREDEAQGSQASAETGSEDECLHGEKQLPEVWKIEGNGTNAHGGIRDGVHGDSRCDAFGLNY